jgi:hypothetical protein
LTSVKSAEIDKDYRGKIELAELARQPEDEKAAENHQGNEKQQEFHPCAVTIALFLEVGDRAAMGASGDIIGNPLAAVEAFHMIHGGFLR